MWPISIRLGITYLLSSAFVEEEEEEEEEEGEGELEEQSPGGRVPVRQFWRRTSGGISFCVGGVLVVVGEEEEEEREERMESVCSRDGRRVWWNSIPLFGVMWEVCRRYWLVELSRNNLK